MSRNELPIDRMTITQARAAAAEILDSTDGDLTGPDAERFAAITARVEQIRAESQARDATRADLLDGVRSGRYKTEGEGRPLPGAERPADLDRDPRDQHRDTALRTLERHVSAGTLPATAAETVESLVEHGPARSRSWAARWATETGSAHYRAAFAKRAVDPDHGHLNWTEPEAAAWRSVAALQSERAMSLTDNAGGYLVPLEADLTIRLTNGGSTVPLLNIARVIPTTSDVWSGVTSAGTTAEWLAEAAEAADASPTLAAPQIPACKMSCFTPFSVELEGDANQLVTQLGTVLGDAAEQLLATALTTGSGSGQPTGIVTALTGAGSVVTGDGSEALAASDFYKVQNALAPRWQPNASWMAALPTINAARQFESANGSLLFPGLHTSPPTLLGRNVYENSVMDSAVNAAATEANYLAIYGDFSQYVVTMRVGSQIELIPHIVGANRRPTGQRGAWLWGRYGADSLIDSAFAMLDVPTTA
ncbi:MAG: phage major capsid protein [Mycolicibacterium sp.]|nr:phage major capsid protein [Mycolicibacterium sp.]